MFLTCLFCKDIRDCELVTCNHALATIGPLFQPVGGTVTNMRHTEGTARHQQFTLSSSLLGVFLHFQLPRPIQPRLVLFIYTTLQGCSGNNPHIYTRTHTHIKKRHIRRVRFAAFLRSPSLPLTQYPNLWKLPTLRTEIKMASNISTLKEELAKETYNLQV